jgi:hypothetical protein
MLYVVDNKKDYNEVTQILKIPKLAKLRIILFVSSYLHLDFDSKALKGKMITFEKKLSTY